MKKWSARRSLQIMGGLYYCVQCPFLICEDATPGDEDDEDMQERSSKSKARACLCTKKMLPCSAGRKHATRRAPAPGCPPGRCSADRVLTIPVVLLRLSLAGTAGEVAGEPLWLRSQISHGKPVGMRKRRYQHEGVAKWLVGPWVRFLYTSML